MKRKKKREFYDFDSVEEIETLMLGLADMLNKIRLEHVGQANFSHKELQNKSCNDIQDMLIFRKVLTGTIYRLIRREENVTVRRK